MRALYRATLTHHRLVEPRGTFRHRTYIWLSSVEGGLRLANPRGFSPLTVYWYLRPNGTVENVVAEVHNTYGQRHSYHLPGERGTVSKELYVSPFLDMEGTYDIRVPLPDTRLSIMVTLTQNDGPSLVATLRGERVRVTPWSRARAAWSALLVAVLIRRHGIALWLRRVPVRPRESVR